MPKRRHPRYPCRAPALIELMGGKRGTRTIRGSLSDISRNGMGLRVVAPETLAAAGMRVLIRFWHVGKTFSIPAEIVWARDGSMEHATLGVRLALQRAAPKARQAFRRWAAAVERERATPGALPVREQLECRLAALTGELERLYDILEGDGALDGSALREVNSAVERLQNTITTLQLRSG